MSNSMISRLVKVSFFIFYIALAPARSSAQDNIYLDGDNYVTLSETGLPSRIVWKELSEVTTRSDAGEYPPRTYWFTHNNHSYILINLRTGKNNLYMELSLDKKAYHFPADYDIPDAKPGQVNDFELFVSDNDGNVRLVSFPRPASLTLHIVQLDPSHLKIGFSGTASCDGAPAGVGPISGKISLSKKNPSLEHLPDQYAGCDHTIYNEMSRQYDLGQWYTATECEESFYRKVFASLQEALSPALTYLGSQGWNMSDAPRYKPLLKRLRSRVNNYFQTDPVSGIDYSLNVNANPQKGAYRDFLQKELDIARQIARDPSRATVLDTMKDTEANRFKLSLQVYFNNSVQTNYRLDLSHARVKKIGSDGYLVENAACASGFSYFEDGGTYLLIGRWKQPVLDDDHISAAPDFPAMPKLSIQTVYVRLGCGPQLAEELIKHLDIGAFQKLLALTP